MRAFRVVGVDPSYQQIVYGMLVIAAVGLTIDRSKLTKSTARSWP